MWHCKNLKLPIIRRMLSRTSMSRERHAHCLFNDVITSCMRGSHSVWWLADDDVTRWISCLLSVERKQLWLNQTEYSFQQFNIIFSFKIYIWINKIMPVRWNISIFDFVLQNNWPGTEHNMKLTQVVPSHNVFQCNAM